VKSPYRFTLLGVAALALAAAGCSGSSSSTSSGGTNWATVTSASGGGGMSTLIAAAKKEGKLNVIALPATWANYGTIIKDFKAKYGITVNSQNPTGSSQDEVNAVKSENGTAKAPDVLDVGMAVALVSTSLFAPYKVSTWSAVPAAQKDANGLWYQDYGGYMSIGYNSAKFGTITSVSQLLGPKFKNAVALNGNPTLANAALSGVMMANLAQGGSAASIAKGVDFFHQLKQVGNFVPVQATTATVKNGTTPVVLDWDYLSASHGTDVPTWKIFVPSNAELGGYYAQAINKAAPHPAAARLWEEYLYSDEGQNLWLEGFARPIELSTLVTDGTVNKTADAALPPAPSGGLTFPTQAQQAAAETVVTQKWPTQVGG